MRDRHTGPVVWEPRHASWFTPAAEKLLASYEVGRVAADPACASTAELPGGWHGIIYYRLHGTPDPYWSRYSASFVRALAARLPRNAWCIFDNTAGGAAIENALELRHALMS